MSDQDFVIREGFPTLRLPGGKGPWIDGEEPLPRHAFWAADALELAHLPALREDCATVFSARAKEDSAAYSVGTTYFLPAVMKPRCALEAMVAAIFQLHTEGLDEGVMTAGQSGAEWWTLVLDEDADDGKSGAQQGVTEGDDDEDEGDEVGLHFDADYGLEDQAPNLLLHPRLATVTYLSDFGAPTIVFDRRSPPPDDVNKSKLAGDIRRGWLSNPAIGKHVCFDGRLLHGAPATFFAPRPDSDASPAKKAKVDRRRITLLVNIWINHCPLDAEPLDDEVCSQLKTPFVRQGKSEGDDTAPAFSWKSIDLTKCSVLPKVTLKPCQHDPAGEEEFVCCSRVVTAKYNASMEDLHAVAGQGDSVEMHFDGGTLVLEIGEGVPESDEEEDEQV